MRYILSTVIIMFVFQSRAIAGNGGPMWIFPVARLCIAQDSAYRQTVLAQFVMSGRLNFKSPVFDDCARKNNWVPRHICDEVMALESEDSLSRKNLERLGSKYAEDLRTLDIAEKYFIAFEKAESANTSLPPCPND